VALPVRLRADVDARAALGEGGVIGGFEERERVAGGQGGEGEEEDD
jgi:hypothetical protein